MAVQQTARSSASLSSSSRPSRNQSGARSPSRSLLEKRKRRRPKVVVDIPLGQSISSRESLQLSSPETPLAALPRSSTSTLSQAIHVGVSPTLTSSPKPSVQPPTGPDDYFGTGWKGGASGRSPQMQASPAHVATFKTNSPLTSKWLSRKASSDSLRRPLLGFSEGGGAYRSEMSPSGGEASRRIDKVRREEYEHPVMSQEDGSSPRRENARHSPSGGRRRERDREKGYRQPSQKAMLGKALEQANTAVLLDNAHNFAGAMDAYGDACALLQQVMMRSSDDEDRRKLDDVVSRPSIGGCRLPDANLECAFSGSHTRIGSTSLGMHPVRRELQTKLYRHVRVALPSSIDVPHNLYRAKASSRLSSRRQRFKGRPMGVFEDRRDTLSHPCRFRRGASL